MNRGFWEKRLKACWRGEGTYIERGLLRMASLVYSLGIRARKGLYRGNLKSVTSLSVPAVSVGNITLGGTGKTPMVAWLAGKFMNAGFAVAVVSRGYHRASEKETLAVSDGERVLASVVEGGDEPVMLARKLPGVVVVAAADRVEGSRLAVEKLGAEVVILDDGFQHLSLARNLDIVLVDGETGFGNGLLFPAGPLREPVGALERSQVLVITKRENGELAEHLRVLFPDIPVFTAPLKVTGAWSLEAGDLPIQSLVGLRAVAFAGIARPGSFFCLLEELGVDLVDRVAFPDHHYYSDQDLERIRGSAGASGSILTTEKDWVRLQFSDLPFSPVVVKVSLEPPEELWGVVCQSIVTGLAGSGRR